ncbi:MAG: hypothetical protein Q7R50_06020 [Dehalococcoidales bacterium]|nr:hypothetical protein [Dehalococcoidales bacterium]
MRLSGMTDAQITEAAGAAQLSTGVSSYLHGIGYSVDTFKQELNSTVNHIKKQMKEPAMAPR